MPEAFLILLAGGILLAAALEDPQQVTLLWLRLCGILALSMAGLSVFFYATRGSTSGVGNALFVSTALAIVGQIAFVQVAKRGAQRTFAAIGAALAIVLGAIFLRPSMTQLAWSQVWMVPIVSAIGIAAMSGLSLMDMLLGHAYLTASKMTIAPFRRINLALAIAMIVRALTASIGPIVVQRMAPVELLWGRFGLYIFTRWFVGLLVPAVFVYMAHDCIKRRSTQSATGILYVAGVLIFIGEIMAVYLVRETGLPF